MADFLIRHLNEKAKEHSALEMLVNQWGFDEKLIPKALQTIGNLFPHYSRHDESHSRQILINIERLLGKENILKLTATDTWLLLEAAYWHDIGMVVPQKDIEEAYNHIEFKQYIQQIQDNPNHDLHRFCQKFNTHDISHCFSGADTPIEAVDKFRQLMAEWFRRQHASRASKIVQAPWENAGISSPRTELIPARLFKLLGRICHMHGLPFHDLLASNGLPYREAGLAQEDCHPRFVACLLRMGDLLDLDDNRFCPVMQRIAGENRPLLSKAHEDKHAGIYHLRVDPERIEITAECKTVDGYLETFKWFDWLKQEIQNQMAHWQDIVPSREFGLLPTLGNIAVRLSGEQLLLKEGERPQFTVDGKQAIELLQGNNLYSSKFAYIRELLQNAVDATLLRLWLTHEKTESSDTWSNPFTKRAKEIFKSSPVEIQFNETIPDIEIPADKTHWNLTITDRGTGISRDDLSYMLRVGGSQKNTLRQTKINSMPEWMKPSGAFGIGFQSVFLICDVIKLTTKSIFTNETLEVTMHSPTGDKEGLVILKPLENDISRIYGTTIEIPFYLEKITRSFSYNLFDTTSIASQFLNSHDPVLDDTLPIEAAQLADKIQEFSINSLLPIHGQLTTKEKAKSFPLGIADTISNDSSQSWNFVEVNGHQVALQYQPVLSAHPANIKTLYRGQPFEQKGLQLPNVDITINLLSGKAGKWLTANRDKLVGGAEEDFSELVLDTLEKLVKKDLENHHVSNLLDQDLKPIYSFFLEAMAIRYGENWLKLAQKFNGAWLDLQTKDKTQTFRALFDKEEWKLGQQSSNEPPVTGCDLLIDHTYGYYLKPIILRNWSETRHHSVQVIESEDYENGDSILRYQFKKVDQPSFSQKALAARLSRILHEVSRNQRFLVDFQDERWDTLQLKDGTKIRASYLFDVSRKNAKFVLLPFLFCNPLFGNKPAEITITPSQLDSLCKWVQPHLETEMPLADIKKKYEELVNHIDDKVMKLSPFSGTWKNARRLD